MQVAPDIREFAKRFKSHDPHLYEQFTTALSEYVTSLLIAVTEASTDEILVAKGRAQQARKFLQLFTETREHNKPTS